MKTTFYIPAILAAICIGVSFLFITDSTLGASFMSAGVWSFLFALKTIKDGK